ncbi:MAG: hypothetical protein U5N10_12710 [Gemmobacter sp.]|nr:hypothetical protein [Gemmobacter sp.]
MGFIGLTEEVEEWDMLSILEVLMEGLRQAEAAGFDSTRNGEHRHLVQCTRNNTILGRVTSPLRRKMIAPQDQQAQEAHTRNILTRIAIPSLTWLPEGDPVRQLQACVNFQAQPGSAIDVITLAYISPVECLTAFIRLIETAKWGEFWELYFERLVPRDVLAGYGALIGCKATAKYLRDEERGRS